ncbi:hypothetical protein BC832DRAFT_113015 [Gaertneriomyces semiglobifer]|nr:hypothetical protein BC832DRAFT_113015 [Gaertneriomyces semiglobifer]
MNCAKFCIQIHQLLSKPRTLRTQADFLIVEPHLLKLLPCLSRFTSTHRKLFFLSSLTYETHAPRTMVSKDGGTAESVYFLLSGNVEFYKTQRGVRFKQNLLNPGEMFGDVSSTSLLSEIGRKRTFNVICINFCEFLRLDLDDYVRIVFAHDGSSIDTLVVLLNSLPIFGNSYETTLFNAARASMLCSLSAGEVILEEDEPSDRLFFLCKGKLRAVKTVSFLRSYTVGTGEGMPVPVVRPYQAGEALQFGEEVFEKELPVCDIEVGAAFPQLYLPEFLVLDPTRPRRANFWPRDLQGGSQNSVSGSDEGLSWLAPRTNIKVYAVTSVQLAAFPVKPFLKLATNEMMEQILGQMRSFDIDTRDLQERYMNSLRTLRGAISSGSNGESVTLLGETGEVEFDR